MVIVFETYLQFALYANYMYIFNCHKYHQRWYFCFNTVDTVYTVDMIYTVDMVFKVHTVDTVYTIQTALRCLN